MLMLISLPQKGGTGNPGTQSQKKTIHAIGEATNAFTSLFRGRYYTYARMQIYLNQNVELVYICNTITN